MQITVRDRALRLLAQREHTKFELRQKLIAKGFEVAVIANTLQLLETQGLQSDARFVESYVAMRMQRGFGPVKIAAELAQRGIEHELSKKFLDAYKDAWIEQAQIIRSKRFGAQLPTDYNQKTKQMLYLYHKGFVAELIKKILLLPFIIVRRSLSLPGLTFSVIARLVRAI